MKKLLFLSAVVLCMVSCNNTPTAYNELNQFEEISQYNDAPFSSQSQKTVCPMCGGTGVFEFMPGDIMAPRMVCPGCNGNGTVTPTQARAIMKAKAQADALTGGTTYGGGYDTNTRERSAYEIELDLRKAYDLLEDMERYSEQCESSVLKIQYARMIVDQKAHIRELEAELRSAY